MAAQTAPPPSSATAPSSTQADAAKVAALERQLQALKDSYVTQVRHLRDIDIRLRALQAQLAGKLAVSGTHPTSATSASPSTSSAASTIAEDRASSTQNAQRQRSVEDVLQQQHALFNRPFTLEAGVTYGHYDRRQLTLNGFLALDAIFLGNIAVEGIKSNALTYDIAARYGLTPRLTLNLDVPYIQTWTNYQKGGAGGSAGAQAEESTYSSPHIGDVNASVNFRLFPASSGHPDVVLTASVIAPTGRSPYGIDVLTTKDSSGFVSFAVPTEQATGNGVWAVNVGASFVKTTSPAIVFGNVGYRYNLSRHFDDLDSSPDTMSPGRVYLGNTISFGGGVAFAFNASTSMSISLLDKIIKESNIKFDGNYSQPVIGSKGNIGMLNLGVTYAVNPHLTWVTLLGVGMTPDAPDFTLSVKFPYQF